MSGKSVLDYQRDYEQLMYRKRQLEEQEALRRESTAQVPTTSILRPEERTERVYVNALRKRDFIPSLTCSAMILDWCRMQFSTSRIVASRCYKQAKEYLDGGAKKKDVILGVKQKMTLSKDDCAKFWGIEMEFKVKKIFRDCFGLVIDECETFYHAKDRTVVAKPDGFVKSGLHLTHLPVNLETGFQLKGLGGEHWLAYESKAPVSGRVPFKVKREYFLQCMLEMACTGCKATLYSVWSPSCFCVWVIYWDQQFWDTVLKPLYFEARVNFDVSGRPLRPEDFARPETRTEREFAISFDAAIDEASDKNCQKIFLAQKLSQNADWRFETCPVVADQPAIDVTKVTTVPVTILTTSNPDRSVSWQKTPDLVTFKTIQQTIFARG